jgi:quercetin dioxygenase-like cupin family protein
MVRSSFTQILRITPIVLIAFVSVVEAQSPIAPGVFWSAATISAGLEKGTGDLGIVAGQTVRPYPGVTIRRRIEGPNNASVHAWNTDKVEMDEIVYIIDGVGTFMTGGSSPDYNNRTAGIKGGEAHDVKPGDIFIIPAGTPHWFSGITGHVTMMEFRYPSLRSQGKANELPKP